MTRGSCFMLVAFLVLSGPVQAAEWTVPLTLSAEKAKATIEFGLSAGATSEYDAGRDVQASPGTNLLTAYFVHAGSKRFLEKDLRGTLPQNYYFVVTRPVIPFTLAWDRKKLPSQTGFVLRDVKAKKQIDMSAQDSYTYQDSDARPEFVIQVSDIGTVRPAPPAAVSIAEQDGTLALKWNAGGVADVAGRKVYIGTLPGQYERAIDLKHAAEYTFRDLRPGMIYYMALTAYDASGTESIYSDEVSGGISAAVTGGRFVASPVGRQAVGSPVTMVANGIGGTGTYEYRFVVRDGTTSVTVQDYSDKGTCAWATSTFAPKEYTLAVMIRSAGSTADHEVTKEMRYTLMSPGSREDNAAVRPSSSSKGPVDDTAGLKNEEPALNSPVEGSQQQNIPAIKTPVDGFPVEDNRPEKEFRFGVKPGDVPNDSDSPVELKAR